MINPMTSPIAVRFSPSLFPGPTVDGAEVFSVYNAGTANKGMCIPLIMTELDRLSRFRCSHLHSGIARGLEKDGQRFRPGTADPELYHCSGTGR